MDEGRVYYDDGTVGGFDPVAVSIMNERARRENRWYRRLTRAAHKWLPILVGLATLVVVLVK